jgi:hypothetical protein
MDQTRFNKVKGKPSRYKLNGCLEYAVTMVTILRTYYNFCRPMKMGSKKITPAHRLGITDKQFDLNDIIYFK